jgi:hypothetical protein
MWYVPPVDMQVALQRTGHLELDIEGMKDILSLLSQKPRVPYQILCSMIESYIPQWKGISNLPTHHTQANGQWYLIRLEREPGSWIPHGEG